MIRSKHRQMLKSVCIISSPVGTTLRLVILLLLCNCSAVISSRALLVIDVQNCFLGNGSLAVKDGEDIIPVINTIRQNYEQHFSLVVFTQDWHCVNHVSFASTHPKHAVYQTINLTYLSTGQLCESEDTRANYTVSCTAQVNNSIVVQQELWPDHCIQDTNDARFHKDLKQEDADVLIRKGQHCEVDSYSGFFDNGGFRQTELHGKLKEKGIQTVFLVGLALDYCLFNTAQDARKLGYDTYVILDATGQIDNSSSTAAIKKMKESGVVLIQSWDLDNILTSSAPGRLDPHIAAFICIFLMINYLYN